MLPEGLSQVPCTGEDPTLSAKAMREQIAFCRKWQALKEKRRLEVIISRLLINGPSIYKVMG